MRHHQIAPAASMSDMNGWFIYIANQLIQPPQAFSQLVDPATKLGSKSTASLFLLAYRHALSTADYSVLELLMQKMTRTQAPSQLEFSRKLAFRLLSTDRPDKLIVLVSTLIQYPKLFNSQEGERESVPFRSTLLAVLSLRQILLITVDVRAALNRSDVYKPLFRWLFAIIMDVLRPLSHAGDSVSGPASATASDTQSPGGAGASPDVDDDNMEEDGGDQISSPTLNARQTQLSLLETLAKVFCDLFLVINDEDIPSLLECGLMEAATMLATCSHVSVIDNSFRFVSYLYEFGGAASCRLLDESRFFDAILAVNFKSANVDVLLTTLQHFATHFIPHIPKRLRVDYMAAFRSLREGSAGQQALANHSVRCMHVMTSVGIRVGITVLYRENTENRRSKQVWMHRQCEGCGKREITFGEFMMCAGCRKVRYCSKDCQVRDWKYHRMSCQFFRPRPGFRSRGTSTPVEQSTQTESSLVSDSAADDMSVSDDFAGASTSVSAPATSVPPTSTSISQFVSNSGFTMITPSAAFSNALNESANNSIASADPPIQPRDNPMDVDAAPVEISHSRESSSSELNGSQTSLDRPRTADAAMVTDLSFYVDIHSWRTAEFTSVQVQTEE